MRLLERTAHIAGPSRPRPRDCRGVLGRVKAPLAALGGFAGLDPSCAFPSRLRLCRAGRI